MASEFLNQLKVLHDYEVGDTFSIRDARVDFPCVHCRSEFTNVVAQIEGVSYALFCSYCLKPSVVWVDNEGNLQSAPAQQPDRAPLGTPDGIVDAWFEGERCFHAGAYNAASMMYRKIIFLVAVDRGMPAKEKNKSAPNFAKCLDYLVSEGYITERHRHVWADAIRIIGNNAAHEIEPITDEQAKVSSYFIRIILETVYEHEVLVQRIHEV